MKDFFNRLDQFSFKDLLAIAFNGWFLFFSYRALTSKDALELVKTLIPLISIILIGYFGTEVTSAYFNRRQNYNNPNIISNPLDPDKPI